MLIKSNLTAASVQRDIVYLSVPDPHLWWVGVLLELLNVRTGFRLVSKFEKEELKSSLTTKPYYGSLMMNLRH